MQLEDIAKFHREHAQHAQKMADDAAKTGSGMAILASEHWHVVVARHNSMADLIEATIKAEKP